MWKDHANAWFVGEDEADDIVSIELEHDGYDKLPSPVRHRRVIRHIIATGHFIVEDRLTGSGQHDVELFFHLAETCVANAEDARCLIDTPAGQICVELNDSSFRLDAISGDEEIPLGWISRRFDVKSPATSLRFSNRIQLPATLTTTIWSLPDGG